MKSVIVIVQSLFYRLSVPEIHMDLFVQELHVTFGHHAPMMNSPGVILYLLRVLKMKVAFLSVYP